MKWTGTDKAVLFLAAGLFVLLYLGVKEGQTGAVRWWIIGLCGCGIMAYANHGGIKRMKKTAALFAELLFHRKR